MKEIKIKIPTPRGLFTGEFRKHLLKAYKELLLAATSIPREHAEKIEEFEKFIAKRR